MVEPREQSHSRAPWEPTTGRPGPAPGGHGAGGPDASRSAPEDWAAALGGAHGGDTQCLEWCPICRTADVVRATASPELREQLNSIQREALITVRALLDHYLQRLDEQPRSANAVEEIPID
jgi:hypothetical protein